LNPAARSIASALSLAARNTFGSSIPAPPAAWGSFGPLPSFLLPRYTHSGYGPHFLLPSRRPVVVLPGPLRNPHLFNAPCSRSSSPGNIAPCKPPLSACSARRTSVMAIAERLVARSVFPKPSVLTFDCYFRNSLI